jgi:plastocyanin
MKKLFVVLMILFVGILVCGCTTQPSTPPATPTAAPATEVPTAALTAAPTAAPTTEAPVTETTTATPTATPTPIPDQKVLIAKTLTFSPSAINIPAGTKVIFYTDASGYKFKVAIEGLGFTEMSGIITPTQTWSYTFNKAGSYTVSEKITPQFRDQKVLITVT